MLAEAVLCFFLALSVYRPTDKPLPRACWLVAVAGGLLALGYLTNDLHFQAVSFPSGVLDDNGQEVNGWLHYTVSVFRYALFALSYVIILIKDLKFVGRRYRWLPLVPFFIGALYFALYPLDIGHRLFVTRVWQQGEMVAFCLIGVLEACIQVGMIPANVGYEKIFSSSAMPAVILDSEGTPVYRSAAAEYPFPESRDVKIRSHEISGGRVEWAVDMKQVRSLNRQIEERAQQIETRNAYLSEENRIRQERAELETRNLMYDSISRIVKPQLDLIDTLLAEGGENGSAEALLPKIAVLSAYIKRRGNMELLSAAGTLTVTELTSAVTESLDYMRLYGVDTALNAVGTGAYPAAMLTAAYENFEAIVEDSLDSLSDLFVSLRSDGPQLTIRMMLKADDFAYESRDPLPSDDGFSRKVTIIKDRQDLLIVLSFTEGGAL